MSKQRDFGPSYAEYRRARFSAPEVRARMENEAARITSMAAVLSALEEAREKRDLSKAEVARRMGRKPEAVSRLLRGAGANPTLATLVELADALEIEINLTITERPKRRRRGYSPLKVRAAV